MASRKKDRPSRFDLYRLAMGSERGVLLAITARLLESGTVELVDYESVAIPGDVPDTFD